MPVTKDDLYANLHRSVANMVAEIGAPPDGPRTVVLRYGCAQGVALGAIRASIEEFRRNPHEFARELLDLIHDITSWVEIYRDNFRAQLVQVRPELAFAMAEQLGIDTTGKTADEVLGLVGAYWQAAGKVAGGGAKAE